MHVTKESGLFPNKKFLQLHTSLLFYSNVFYTPYKITEKKNYFQSVMKTAMKSVMIEHQNCTFFLPEFYRGETERYRNCRLLKPMHGIQSLSHTGPPLTCRGHWLRSFCIWNKEDWVRQVSWAELVLFFKRN